MTPELQAQLKRLVNFPSPPGVAVNIIEMAQDPSVELGRVAKALGQDPALAAKILRIANSALYAQRRRSENLRQALVVLGLNATLTLALSFTLVKTLKGGRPNSLNYPHYWRRSLLSAVAARALGDATGQTLGEELFLAALLQDIGVLALDRSIPDLYQELAERQDNHKAVAIHEQKRLGLDHAEAGAWLMQQWNLPERVWRAAAASHRLDTRRVTNPEDAFARCVALSGQIADLFLSSDDREAAMSEVAQQAERSFGLDREGLGAIIARITTLIPETESLFDTPLVKDPDGILEQAREILMVRNLHTLREVSSLRMTADSLSARAMELEAETRRDALTGVFNRSFLEQYLAREFEGATRQGWPLSVAFCDLDHFKRINDTLGHQAGDRILQATARILSSNTRDSDVVARYGGEEFVMVLPATDSATCRTVCERIITAFRETQHQTGDKPVNVTISIGFATHTADTPFDSVEALVHAADQALYSAKLGGRNRAMQFGEPERVPMVRFL